MIRIEEGDLDDAINAAEATLTEALDSMLYLPVKAELKKRGPGECTHSLGQKKELFKGEMERVFNALRDIIVLGGR